MDWIEIETIKKSPEFQDLCLGITGSNGAMAADKLYDTGTSLVQGGVPPS